MKSPTAREAVAAARGERDGSACGHQSPRLEKSEKHEIRSQFRKREIYKCAKVMGRGEGVKMKVLQRKVISKYLQKHITSPMTDKELKDIFQTKLKSSIKLKLGDGKVSLK